MRNAKCNEKVKRTGTGSGFLVLAARARQAIKSPILTIYVSYAIENAWRKRVAITAPVRTRAALEMPSLPCQQGL